MIIFSLKKIVSGGFSRETISKTMAGLIPFWPFLLPVLVYLPGILGWIPFPSEQADHSDLLLNHYPYALFLKENLLGNFSIPLWMPNLLSGFPLAANPLSGLWYPGGWPALLFPLPAGLSVMVAAHIVWGEVGCYLYLRSAGVSQRSAMLGGLIFGFLPKFSAHYGAGHVTLIYAVSWTPWLIIHRSVQRAWLAEGAVLAMIFLADPRWIAYSGVLWLFYRWVHKRGGLRQFVRQVGAAAGFSLLGAAPLLLPLIEYLGRSSRINLGPKDVFAYSLPPAGILGLFFPKGGGNPEWELYLGGIGLTAVLLALMVREKGKTLRFWLAAFLLSFVWAFGDHLPFLLPAARIPGVSLLRVPPRAVFIMGLAASAAAGFAGRAYCDGRLDLKKARLAVAGVVTAGVLSILGLLLLIGNFQLNLLAGLTALILGAGVIFTLFSGEERRPWNIWLIVALIAADGLTAGLINYHPRNLQDLNAGSQALLEKFSGEKQLYRIYSPSAGIPQHLAVEEGLDLAHGVDPLQLKNYRQAFLEAAGVVDQGYDVSIPPYYGEQPSTAHRFAEPSPELLGLFNVLYIESDFSLGDIPQLMDLGRVGTSQLYQNRAFQPRAWTTRTNLEGLDQLKRLEDVEKNSAKITEYRPNRIVLDAEGPGYLVLSELYYPGWKAEIDGQKVPVLTAGNLFRAVELSSGDQQVIFRYQPLAVGLGCAGGVMAVGIYLFLRRRDASFD